jgi:uncharacterized protein YacL
MKYLITSNILLVIMTIIFSLFNYILFIKHKQNLHRDFHYGDLRNENDALKSTIKLLKKQIEKTTKP